MFRGLEEILGKAIKIGQESGGIAHSLLNTLNGICVLEKTGASVKEMNVIVDMALTQIRV